MKFDYIFAFSARPVPRQIERVRSAVKANCRVALFYLERPLETVDTVDIDGVTAFSLQIAFSNTSLSRLMAIPKIVAWLRKILHSEVDDGAIAYVDSLDLLGAFHLASRKKKVKFHYEVRDLHGLQTATSAIGRAVQFVDRRLMKHVSMLVLTSQRYYDVYYSKFYKNDYCVLENWPTISAWSEFQPSQRKIGDSFVIGFIGFIRYLDCVRVMFSACQVLRAEGLDIQVKIAGPLLNGDLQLPPDATWIKQGGPFSYDDDIKELYQDVDLIWSVYDPRIKNVQYALSNKLYESLLSKIPILAAEDTYLGQCVVEQGIGTTAPALDVQGMANVLRQVFESSNWHENASSRLKEKPVDTDKLQSKFADAEARALFGNNKTDRDLLKK